ESGAGTLGYIDEQTQKYHPVADLPGFTRGLDFAGNLAFVGLSQVRESAVFSGIPITDRLAENERTCGICVIDLVSGQVVALLRFETAVQEIFAVKVLDISFTKGPERKVAAIYSSRDIPAEYRDPPPTFWQRIQDEYRYQKRRLGW